MRPATESFWGSNSGLLLVLVLVFVAAFIIATMLIGTGARRRREQSLIRILGRRRKATVDEHPKEVESHWVPERLAEVGERFASAAGFTAALEQRLERAGAKMLPGEFLAMVVLAAVAGAVFAALVLANIIFVLLIAGLAGFLPFLWLARGERRRRNALSEQLADTLSILASSLRAGYSFLQALDTVSKEIGEPSASEFQRVVAEIRLGRPVDDALVAMAQRVGSEDLKWAVIAINIQRQVGGNLAEVLDIVANTVRERAYIQRQVRVLSAEGRISVAILAAIPFVLLLYLSIIRPEYISLLFTRAMGLVMLSVGGVLLALGIWIMTRIVKIDV